MQRILLPTDFSENSLHAIDYAMRYFSGIKMTFFILNVQKSSEFIMDDLMASNPGSTVHNAIAGDNKQALLDLVNTYREAYSHEPFSFEILFDYDSLVDAVKQIVVEKNIELIIMGSNGASDAKEVIFGSNTLQLIRSIDCPVIAVPSAYNFEQINEVLLSIADNNIPNIADLKPLAAFIRIHKPILHMLRVFSKENFEDNSEAISNIKQLFPETTVVCHAVSDVPLPMVIATFVQLKHIDLHALMVEKKGFLDRFIFGSSTSKISYGSKVPLLFLNSSNH